MTVGTVCHDLGLSPPTTGLVKVPRMSDADQPGVGRPAAPPEPRPSDAGDWPAQAAGSIVDLVAQSRDKTTGRATTAARGVVFGTLITVIALVGGISLVIAMVRVTQTFLEHVVGLSPETAVWASYLIVGALFTICGLLLWRLANRKAVEQADLTGP